MTKLPRIARRDFEAIRQLLKGDSSFPQSYEEWLKLGEKWSALYGERIYEDVDPRQFAEFVANSGHGNNLKALIAFVAEKKPPGA